MVGHFAERRGLEDSLIAVHPRHERFYVYALWSDGNLMEGIGGEAASITGHLELGNLCWMYDDNRITIKGETEFGRRRSLEHINAFLANGYGKRHSAGALPRRL